MYILIRIILVTLRGIFLLLEFILCTQFNAACLISNMVYSVTTYLENLEKSWN